MESFLNFLKQLFKWTGITVVSLIVVIYAVASIFDMYEMHQEKIDEQFVLQCIPKDLPDLPDGAVSADIYSSFLIRSSKRSRGTDKYYEDAWAYSVTFSSLGSEYPVYSWSKDYQIAQTDRYIYITTGLYDALKLLDGEFEDITPYFTVDRMTLLGYSYDSEGRTNEPLKCKKVDPKPYFDLIKKTTEEFESARQI